MPRLLMFLGLLSCFVELRAAEPAPIDDPGRMLPADAAQAVEARLAAFERTAGIRMLVRFHAKSPTAEEDKVPGAYMQALAGKLGARQRGVLVVYFADDPDWRVWIGDDLTSRFAGKPGTVQELTDSGAIHEVKEALLAAARAQADAAFTALQKTSSTDRPPAPARRLALHLGALLDALMGRFAPQ